MYTAKKMVITFTEPTEDILVSKEDDTILEISGLYYDGGPVSGYRIDWSVASGNSSNVYMDSSDTLPYSKNTGGSGNCSITLSFKDAVEAGDEFIIRATAAETTTYADSPKITVGFKVEITSVTPQTFTTKDTENDINCVADIKPDSLDTNYNDDIEWDIEDNPYESGNSGDPDDPDNGNNVTWSATIPPIPTASKGRGFPLSYRIRARLTIGSDTVISDTVITQDEIDQCRQEYIDFNYSRNIPARSRFTNNRHSTHYTFNALNRGDYSWALVEQSLLEGLEATGTNFPNHWEDISNAYRNPIRNASIGGATNSRHIYGDAVDIGLQDWDKDGDKDEDDWILMKNAADAEGATYIEPYEDTKPIPGVREGWVHMDWR